MRDQGKGFSRNESALTVSGYTRNAGKPMCQNRRNQQHPLRTVGNIDLAKSCIWRDACRYNVNLTSL